MYFSKYHGTGNDFIIVEQLNEELQLTKQTIESLCHRHFGIGADGLMIVKQSQLAAYKMQYFNADGTEATMCGNGARCFVKYLIDHQLMSLNEFAIETLAGIIKVKVNQEKISINLNSPITTHPSLPKNNEDAYQLTVGNKLYVLYTLFLGTIHTIVFVDKICEAEVLEIGPLIEKHSRFPMHTNVNFCEVINRELIKVSTWEKGVGHTLACGTGVSSCAVVCKRLGLTDSDVTVSVEGGVLIVSVCEDVYLTGPAVLICEGEYFL